MSLCQIIHSSIESLGTGSWMRMVTQHNNDRARPILVTFHTVHNSVMLCWRCCWHSVCVMLCWRCCWHSVCVMLCWWCCWHSVCVMLCWRCCWHSVCVMLCWWCCWHSVCVMLCWQCCWQTLSVSCYADGAADTLSVYRLSIGHYPLDEHHSSDIVLMDCSLPLSCYNVSKIEL